MKHPIAKIHTGKGVITVELYPEHAPNTVNSFIWAAKENMYENRLIKRVVPGFVLQPSYCFFDDKRCDYMLEGEFEANGIKNELKFAKGIVAMAGNGSDEAHGCEFFITLADEAAERLNGKYAAFGKVIDGYEEVERIENVELQEVSPKGMEKAKVKQPVVDEFMVHVEVETFGVDYPKPNIKYWVDKGETMMKKIGIIALDLDGTLLDSDKNLSEGNRAALERAAEAGIEIVPTTGRFYGGIPEVIRNLPFIHYAITINGAQLADIRSGEVIYKAELPWDQSVEILKEFDGHPLIYDCYQDNCGWMTESMKADIDTYAPNIHYNRMLRDLRKPVPELKEFLAERKLGVQKVQFFTSDLSFREKMMEELPQRFENIAVTSSAYNNLEVNQLYATKGEALKALARHLGLEEDATMSFGDALNDLSMLRSAGIGVAMANAEPEAKEAADYITASNDEDGVAKAIYKFCFGEE